MVLQIIFLIGQSQTRTAYGYSCMIGTK